MSAGVPPESSLSPATEAATEPTTTAPSTPAADTWAALRQLTPARIGLGRSGASLLTRELLAFGLDHARARDAVHAALDVPALAAALASVFEHPAQTLTSAAGNRAAYLARPDWGRRLAPESAAALCAAASAMTAARPTASASAQAPAPASARAPTLTTESATPTVEAVAVATDLAEHAPPDLLFVIADGLSAQAAQRHALPLLRATLPRLIAAGLHIAPPVIATQARVALADEIAAILGARLVVSLIGERPGLTAPDSLGAYLTYAPQPGRTTDAERDCLSNIRPGGLDPADAGERLATHILDALARQRTGVAGY